MRKAPPGLLLVSPWQFEPVWTVQYVWFGHLLTELLIIWPNELLLWLNKYTSNTIDPIKGLKLDLNGVTLPNICYMSVVLSHKKEIQLEYKIRKYDVGLKWRQHMCWIICWLWAVEDVVFLNTALKSFVTVTFWHRKMETYAKML